MKIKDILFDKDGTLIDFFVVWGNSAYPVADKLLEYYPYVNKEDILKSWSIENGRLNAEGALAWKPYDDIVEDMSPCLGLVTNKEKKECELLLKQLFYEEVCEKMENYPTFTNVKALIEELKVRDIKVGIATTDEYHSTIHCLKKLDIYKDISFIACDDGHTPLKPDGTIIKMAADKWQIRQDEIMVVGDSFNDMKFAHYGGAKAIGVLSGVSNYDQLVNCADYIISSVDELIALLDKGED